MLDISLSYILNACKIHCELVSQEWPRYCQKVYRTKSPKWLRRPCLFKRPSSEPDFSIRETTDGLLWSTPGLRRSISVHLGPPKRTLATPEIVRHHLPLQKDQGFKLCLSEPLSSMLSKVCKIVSVVVWKGVACLEEARCSLCVCVWDRERCRVPLPDQVDRWLNRNTQKAMKRKDARQSERMQDR